jgi:predicted transcriptional regulator
VPAPSTSIKLDPQMKDRVQRLAASRKRTAHWVMKEAIEQYVEREEKREAFNREAVEAWEEYQATGLHVTHEEMMTWLESWGTENEIPPPECHT